MNLLQTRFFGFYVRRFIYCLTFSIINFNYFEIDFLQHEKCELMVMGREYCSCVPPPAASILK